MAKKKRYVKTRASEVDLVGKPLTEWIAAKGGIATLGEDGRLEANQWPAGLDNTSTVVYLTTGSANNYIITAPGIELREGVKLQVKFHAANTSATVNINFNNSGNIRLYGYGTTGPTANNISINSIRELIYTDGLWRLTDYQYFTSRSSLSDYVTYGSDAQFGTYRGSAGTNLNQYILLCTLKLTYNATYYIAHSGLWEIKCIETSRLLNSDVSSLENFTVKVRAQLNPTSSGGTLFNAAIPELKVLVSGNLQVSTPDNIVAFVSANSTSTKTISVYKKVTRYGQIYNVIPVNHRIQSLSASASSNACTSFTAASASAAPVNTLPAVTQGSICAGTPEGRIEINSYEEFNILTNAGILEYLNKETGDMGYLVVAVNSDHTGIQYLFTGNSSYRRNGRWSQDGTSAYWDDWYPLSHTDYALDTNITPRRWINQQPVYERVIKIPKVDYGQPAQVMIGHNFRIIDIKGSYTKEDGKQYPIFTSHFPRISVQGVLISYEPSNGWLELETFYTSITDIYLILEYSQDGNGYYYDGSEEGFQEQGKIIIEREHLYNGGRIYNTYNNIYGSYASMWNDFFNGTGGIIQTAISFYIKESNGAYTTAHLILVDYIQNTRQTVYQLQDSGTLMSLYLVGTPTSDFFNVQT